MRFGINTFLFTSPFTNESTKLFPQFKKWGFESIEIPVEDPSHIDPAYVKRELDKNGLVCGTVCACMGPDRDLRGDATQQKTGLEYMMKVLDQMVVLDCPSLIGPVYSSVGRADAVPAVFCSRHDMDLIEETTGEGARKPFQITDEGRTHLEENAGEADELMSRLKALSPSHYPEGGSPVWRAMRNLGVAIRNRLQHGEVSEDTVHELAALIDEFAQRVERLK